MSRKNGKSDEKGGFGDEELSRVETKQKEAMKEGAGGCDNWERRSCLSCQCRGDEEVEAASTVVAVLEAATTAVMVLVVVVMVEEEEEASANTQLVR
ncbi:unnamed protein product [Hydatigera taeniaeformis]|uniref:Uncharacterized protein n=1 Tax=Hydatigena taeniaeformis TaxID=6205 RepID=A0A0R3WPY0_HYDTA|nr:unnamed protein product [Hydatigera taeniaeformis]